ncbi:cytochrome P450 [Streptomyces sp. NBC_00102]|uniref:cytochrome P450 n=1 Tax=Streptomyces sp. NBC_00102 TaxID=2975652 RepID=UPI002252DC73|nr:cytochrome P450 [Streptomyces sp. NBC_00102]MCX5399880.1 cytochrome P450 [Streptomyces sp. NBC_00102]
MSSPDSSPDHEVETYPFGPYQRLDMHPKYAQYRTERPVVRVRMPYGGEAWLATNYEDSKTVMADPRFSRAATIGADVPRSRQAFEDPIIVALDPPEHTRLRKLVTKAFTSRRIERLRPNVQSIVDKLVDDLIATGGPADLAETVAWPLPITVICELLGVPAADQQKFRALVDVWLTTGDERPLEEVSAALKELMGYMGDLIGKRRAEPQDDLLSALTAASEDGDKLSEDELVLLGITLLAAGHKTTANQLSSHVFALLEDRERWEELVASPELVPSAVEELLRYAPLAPASDNTRIALEDVELSGQLIKAGEAVMINYASANRDASVFPNPDRLDFHRETNPHVAFGHGLHHCLGAPLARMELQLALTALVTRLPQLELAVPAGEVPWRKESVARGVRELPVRW